MKDLLTYKGQGQESFSIRAGFPISGRISINNYFTTNLSGATIAGRPCPIYR